MDKAFAQRLNLACDGHPEIPPYGSGRQTWIKEKMDVSHEAVRKWFTGEARPRPAMMRRLKALLEVDEAWLSLGIAPEMQPKERKARNAIAEGAVNVFTGMIQINGGNVAFPDEKDPRSEYVDLYTIIRGSQFAIHVALGQRMSENVYRFSVPREYDQCTVVGAIQAFPMRMHFIAMSNDMIDRHKVRKGGYFEITVNHTGSTYTTGSDTWHRITSLTDRI